MDVHDVKSASKSMQLRPGMVITVEPGTLTLSFIPEKVEKK